LVPAYVTINNKKYYIRMFHYTSLIPNNLWNTIYISKNPTILPRPENHFIGNIQCFKLEDIKEELENMLFTRHSDLGNQTTLNLMNKMYLVIPQYYKLSNEYSETKCLELLIDLLNVDIAKLDNHAYKISNFIDLYNDLCEKKNKS